MISPRFGPNLLLQCGLLCIMLQLLVLSDANFLTPEIFGGEKHLSTVGKNCREKRTRHLRCFCLERF
jgi:hypothetical protein